MTNTGQRMTIVINLLGAPSTGKSTLACELYAKMKYKNYNVELVREVAKELAWEGKNLSAFDQLYVIGEQIKRESALYGKVDIIITDSPIALGGFYMEHCHKQTFMTPMIKNFYDFAISQNVVYMNHFLVRKGEYDPKGRFQDETQARFIDAQLELYLEQFPHFDYSKLDIEKEKRADYILLNLENLLPCHI